MRTNKFIIGSLILGLLAQLTMIATPLVMAIEKEQISVLIKENMKPIANGGSVYFGNVPIHAVSTKTFVINNVSGRPLNIIDVEISTPVFELTAPFEKILLKGGLTTTQFEIRLNTDTLGTFDGRVKIKNGSSDNHFTFSVTGSVGGEVEACASVIYVTQPVDSGAGTLRQALADLCEGGVIEIDDTQVTKLSLTSGPLLIDKNITITTLSGIPVTLRRDDSAAPFGIFSIEPQLTQVRLEHLRVENGLAVQGSGIYNAGSEVTLVDTHLCYNSGSNALYNVAPGLVTLENSRVCYNEGDGVLNQGKLNIVGSYIEANQGHGISTTNDFLSIYDSCIAGNALYGILNTGTDDLVEASQNWWGSANGPSIDSLGDGEAISGLIDYAPIAETPPLPDCLAASYVSEPEVGESIEITGEPGVSASQSITIKSEGQYRLHVNLKKLTGAHQNQFLLDPIFPFDLAAPGDEQVVTVHCTPLFDQVYTATLHLQTNAPASHNNVSYTLSCQSTILTEETPPTYTSIPAPEASIALGQVRVGDKVTTTLAIEKLGTGPLALALVIEGEHRHDFMVSTNHLNIDDTAPLQDITLQCIPSTIGSRQATLIVTNTLSNFPQQFTYPLTCAGVQANYASIPAAGETLDIGTGTVGNTLSQSLVINEIGEADLVITAMALRGAQAAYFNLESSYLPLTIADGQGAERVYISCTPTQAILYKAILVVHHNAANIPSPIYYDLVCQGKTPVTSSITYASYMSIPAPDSRIMLGSSPVGQPIYQDIHIGKVGTGNLTVNWVALHSEQDSFAIVTPEITAFPLNVPEEGIDLTVACTPTTVDSQTATLELISSDPQRRLLAYELVCIGTELPVHLTVNEEILNVGEVVVGTMAHRTFTLLTVEQGTITLTSSTIVGEQAADFKVKIPDFPIQRSTEETTLDAEVQCTPTAVGPRTATLILSSASADYAELRYALTCTGMPLSQPVVTPPDIDPPADTPQTTPVIQNEQAAYDSVPLPNSILNLGSSEVGTATATALTALKSGTGTLTLLDSYIDGAQAEYFSIIAADLPVTLTDEEPTYTLKVRCTPAYIGQHQAVLRLKTDAVEQPEKVYELMCQGLAKPPQAIFAGEILTEAGAYGKYISIDAPESFVLNGYIQPDEQHIGQPAKIVVFYHWWPNNGGPKVTAFMTIDTHRVLEILTTLTLFEGSLTEMEGTFQIDLSYQVGREFLSDTIATLIVKTNRAPTDIVLSTNTIAEDSRKGTLVGTLQGVDPDQGEAFIFGLLDDAEGRFKIVDNKLQVAKNGWLDFDQNAEHSIVVQGVDLAGAHIEKTFTIYLTRTDGPAQQIRLISQPVHENSAINTVVGRLINPDPCEYELLNDAAGQFKLIGNSLVTASDLDFENQPYPTVTVRCREQLDLIETFPVDLINVTDVQVTNKAIFNQKGQLITDATPSETVLIEIQMIPDIEHRGKTAHLIGVAIQEENGIAMMLDNERWVYWNGYLANLQIAHPLTLQAVQDVILWQGHLTAFNAGNLQIFVGYQLDNSENIFFSPTPIILEIY